MSTPLGRVLVLPDQKHSPVRLQPAAGSPLRLPSPPYFREMLVLMGPQARQAPLGLEGRLDDLGLMVFQGSLVLW